MNRRISSLAPGPAMACSLDTSLRARWQRGLGLARSLLIYRRPGRLAGLKRLYRPLVPDSGLVFDVGAHLGDRTRAFRALGARVVAVEPQPGPLRWLKRLHGRDPGVAIEACALAERSGQARLAISRHHPSVATLAEDWPDAVRKRNPGFRQVAWEDSLEVETSTLDCLIERHGRPDFIKIDTEGHEAAVLAGLSQAVAALSVEFVAGTLERTRDCIERLEALAGYRFNAVAGERRDMLWPEWRPAADVLAWLDSGADGLPSGDLYARRTP